MPCDRTQIFAEIDKEREYQDSKWGGPEIDDQENLPNDWVAYIAAYATKWFPGGFSPYSDEAMANFRKGMVKVAALAVAAIEQVDRGSGIVYTPVDPDGE